MVYGYARVSTKLQKDDGNSLEAQIAAVRRAGAQEVYIETYTGAQFNRPRLDELLSTLKSGDTLIVTKMDRLSRTVGQATETITDLIDKGVSINILNLGILDNSSMSVLVRNILLSFAQFEREMIVERTQEGRALARLKPGYKEGRPKKFNEEQRDLAISLLEKYSYKKVSKMTGISISSLTRLKREWRQSMSEKEQAETIIRMEEVILK
jgi:DNA invertase Pin-like site-specific DNA recombinase